MSWQIIATVAIMAICFIAAVVAAIRKIVTGEYKTDYKVSEYNKEEYEDFCSDNNLTTADRPQIIVNPEMIPDCLHSLIPVAEEWGISDDVIRCNCLSAASTAEREELIKAVEAVRKEFELWLKETDVLKHPDWTALAWTMTAAMDAAEMRAC